MTTDELIKLLAEKWRSCQDAPESTLLRLECLRELVNGLHSAKSQCLASGQKSQALCLRTREDRVESLRERGPLELPLEELLENPEKAKKRTRHLPESLYSVIGREKLDRYDRIWESTLAAEGCLQGWHFWVLEAHVEILGAQSWHERLRSELWPHGLVLFVESAPPAPLKADELKRIAHESAGSAWHGRWLIMLHPRFRSPGMELSLQFKSWAGTCQVTERDKNAPLDQTGTVTWKRVYVPKSL